MKKLLILLLITISVTACTKNKCEGCTATTSIYENDVLVSRTVSQVDCGVKPGTTVKRGQMGGDKTVTNIQTITCR
jgi:hypothetical protein